MVVVTPGSDAATMAKVKLLNPGRLVEATPENPAGKSSNGTLHVPARSVPVLIEL